MCSLRAREARKIQGLRIMDGHPPASANCEDSSNWLQLLQYFTTFDWTVSWGR